MLNPYKKSKWKKKWTVGEACTPEYDGPGLSELEKKNKSESAGFEPNLLTSRIDRPTAAPKEQW